MDRSRKHSRAFEFLESSTSRRLKTFINKIQQSNDLTDIFFQVDAEEFDLHRIVLGSAMTDYVMAHQNTGAKMSGEGTTPDNRIVLRNFPGGVGCFVEIIKFTYGDASFNINSDNVASLYYAAKYFHMVGTENLADCVEIYLNEDVFRKETKHLPLVTLLYMNAIELESEHSLPADLSQQCLSQLAFFVDNGEADLCEEISEFLYFPDLAGIVVEAEKQKKSPQDIVNFVAKVVAQEHIFFCKTKPKIELTVQQLPSLPILVDKLDTSIMAERYASLLFSLEDELFLDLKLTRTKLMESYLTKCERTTPIIALVARQCIDVLNRLLKDPYQKENGLVQALQLSKSVISSVLVKLSYKGVGANIPLRLRRYVVEGAGTSIVNGEFHYEESGGRVPSRFVSNRPDGSKVYMLRYTRTDKFTEWIISPHDLDCIEGERTTDYYYNELQEETEEVPEELWKEEAGLSPPPKITWFCPYSDIPISELRNLT